LRSMAEAAGTLVVAVWAADILAGARVRAPAAGMRVRHRVIRLRVGVPREADREVAQPAGMAARGIRRIRMVAAGGGILFIVHRRTRQR
jgi:hypothetical protein